MTLLYVSNYLLVYFISVLFIHSFIYIYPYFLSLFIFLFVCVINWNKALIVELFESMSACLFNGLYFHFSVRSPARLSVINFCQNWLISTFLKKYFYIELTSPKWSKLKERNSLNKFYFSCLSPKDYPKSYFLDSLKKVNFMFI